MNTKGLNVVKPNKCNFCHQELLFLGLTTEGIKPNSEKVERIANCPPQKDPAEVASFLGLVGYYCKFVENYTKISKPLEDLKRKGVPWRWEEEEQEVFNAKKTSHFQPNSRLSGF